MFSGATAIAAVAGFVGRGPFSRLCPIPDAGSWGVKTRGNGSSLEIAQPEFTNPFDYLNVLVKSLGFAVVGVGS